MGGDRKVCRGEQDAQDVQDGLVLVQDVLASARPSNASVVQLATVSLYPTIEKKNGCQNSK